MSTSSPTRSALATVVGWVIVAVVVYWFLGAVIGTIRFLVRFLAWIVVLGVLAVIYFRLRAPED